MFRGRLPLTRIFRSSSILTKLFLSSIYNKTRMRGGHRFLTTVEESKGYKGIMHDCTLECGCTTTLFPFKMGLEINIYNLERNPITDGSRSMFENKR
jgi:hypothetical protein